MRATKADAGALVYIGLVAAFQYLLFRFTARRSDVPVDGWQEKVLIGWAAAGTLFGATGVAVAASKRAWLHAGVGALSTAVPAVLLGYLLQGPAGLMNDDGDKRRVFYHYYALFALSVLAATVVGILAKIVSR